MTAFDTPTTYNTACPHPRAEHRHGTYACYTLDKCRCKECSKAAVAYRGWETRRRAYARANPNEERYQPYVDAAPVVAHLDALQAAGLSYKEVARRAGVAASSLSAMLWATPSRGRRRRTRVSRKTRYKVLAVPIPTPEQLLDGRRITAVPTTNRLRALQSIGYSLLELARRAGIDHQRLRRAAAHPELTTTVRTHKAVAALFAELWATPNEPVEWRSKIAASRARNVAHDAGYPMPIDLNDAGYLDTDLCDDETIDDPDGAPVAAEPAPDLVDELAVARVLAGEPPALLTSKEVDEVIRRGAAQGLNFRELASRLRMSHAAVQARASRAGVRSQAQGGRAA